jgi:HlyD family secretion protein
MNKTQKQFSLIFFALVALILLVWFLSRPEKDTGTSVEVAAKKGTFQITVTTTGELEARSSEKIFGPSPTLLREARIWQLKIDDIIPDGTIVDSGDYVAQLDRTELTNKLKDQEIDIEQFQNNFTKTQLDTTMELRAARNELINLQYAVEEAQIAVDQSIYEPPASQRQVQIEFDRAMRSLDQAERNYSLKYEKAVANMSEVATALRKKQTEYSKFIELSREFTIQAPKAGMVIYQRDWDGKKRGIGSSISSWENVVATLPNLKEMITKTYINEIDISKVKVGQPVEIGVDAFPEKRFTGQVIEVANIGEQLRNSNARVFEVKVEVNEYDSIIRPAMTTKNTIITEVIEDVVYVPLEAINILDSIKYVFTGNRRQQVIPGKANENEIIIRYGLSEGDLVRLSVPEKPESFKLNTLPDDILTLVKEETIKPIAQPDTTQKTISTSGDHSPQKQEKQSKRRGGGRNQ